jgi:hypothetical protein
MTLTCTDRAKVDELFSAAAPRPIREVILEVYPDAVEDANGRFHAPYDGYECPITGQQFRGGEFLPMDEVEDPMERAMRAPGSTRRLPEARVLATGEVVRWSGTRAQNAAAWAELIRQTREHDAGISRHVGEVGQMVELRDLVLQFVKGFDGYYGTTFIHVLKDPSGNVIVYKGSKRLTTGPSKVLDRVAEKGQRVSIRAKVKAHGERDGVAQTVVERPKAI